MSLWLYRATPDPWSDHRLGVVDGDTLDLLMDLGMWTFKRERVRLAGVDTAEIYAPDTEAEYQAGKDQARFVEEWLASRASEPWPLRVLTEKDETGKYGRLMAHVGRASADRDLATDLVAAFPEVADE